MRKMPMYADCKKLGKSKLSVLKQPTLLTESKALVALCRTLGADAKKRCEAVAAAATCRDN